MSNDYCIVVAEVDLGDVLCVTRVKSRSIVSLVADAGECRAVGTTDSRI